MEGLVDLDCVRLCWNSLELCSCWSFSEFEPTSRDQVECDLHLEHLKLKKYIFMWMLESNVKLYILQIHSYKLQDHFNAMSS